MWEQMTFDICILTMTVTDRQNRQQEHATQAATTTTAGPATNTRDTQWSRVSNLATNCLSLKKFLVMNNEQDTTTHLPLPPTQIVRSFGPLPIHTASIDCKLLLLT